MIMRVLLSWSTGKDAAWALHSLRRQDVEVVGLLTTLNQVANRVSMHSVRRALAEAQADSAGLPLRVVELPWPCSNEAYEARMQAALKAADAERVTHVAFGDLFLEDVRAYRERQLDGTRLKPLFPLWHPPGGTTALAREILESGLQAVVTCIDPAQIPASFAGRSYDQAFLEDLPGEADPCGERGEFHTFCHDGPMFRRPVPVSMGEQVERDGFYYADVLPLRESA